MLGNTPFSTCWKSTIGTLTVLHYNGGRSRHSCELLCPSVIKKRCGTTVNPSPSKIQVGRAYCTCWTDKKGHDRPCPPISFVLHCTHYLCGDVLFVSRARITLFHCGIFSHNLHKTCSSQIIISDHKGQRLARCYTPWCVYRVQAH